MARELYHDDCYNESVGMYTTKVKHNVTVVLHYQWSLGYTSPSMTVTRGEEERKEAVSGWRVILVGCPSLPSSSTSSASPSVLAPYLGCSWVSNECPLHFHAPFFTSDGISSNYLDECKPPTVILYHSCMTSVFGFRWVVLPDGEGGGVWSSQHGQLVRQLWHHLCLPAPPGKGDDTRIHYNTTL